VVQAAAIDAKVAANEPLGQLAGVPIAIKDNICTKGIQTSAASQYLRGYMPPYDATVISKLRDAGAVLVGKTNMDEFGMGSTTENSSFHTTRNAWSASHVPGASHSPSERDELWACLSDLGIESVSSE
jgi:aspartyl-tRNA(Asn)/glutamyl-tRNA(Gln) amidotransferase subunit A